MSAELKPCPFCGGKAKRIDIEEGKNAGGSYICCTVCNASGNLEFGFKEDFVANWNRRTDLSQAAVAAALEAAANAAWLAGPSQDLSHEELSDVGKERRAMALRCEAAIRALITPAQHDALAAHVAAEVAKARAEDAAKLLAAAGQEYVLEHVMETDWHRQGRHSAVRGMMVRMGLYAELEGAIDAALAQIGAKP